MLFAELRRRGYEAIPVRPGTEAIDGQTVYARVQDIPGPVDGAIVMTPAAVALQIARDCHEAKIPRVWLHRGAGKGAVSDEAVQYCREQGLEVVPGECPFMFLGGSIHGVHRSLRKLTDNLPVCGAEQAAAERVTKVLLGALLALELFVAVGALYGAGNLIAAPGGTPMGLPLPAELPGLRFGSYLVPGLILLVANALLPAAVIVGALTGRRWSVRGHLVVGMMLTGWTAIEVLMLGWISFLQPLMLGLGIAIFVLGSLYQARRQGAHRRLALATEHA